jgi:hypothetical protein
MPQSTPPPAPFAHWQPIKLAAKAYAIRHGIPLPPGFRPETNAAGPAFRALVVAIEQAAGLDVDDGSVGPQVLGALGPFLGTSPSHGGVQAGDPLCFSHGSEAGPLAITLSNESQFHAGEPVTWLRIPGLPARADDPTRQRFVALARFAIAQAKHIHYSQDDHLRMAWERAARHVKPPIAPNALPLEVFEDCSSSISGLAALAGAPDPNGSGFDGSGFTGTMLGHCTRLGSGAPPRGLLPGDIAVYGDGNGTHAMLVIDAFRPSAGR